ncbi:hypothetical protein BDQ17DRAFT_1373225 [Cyathus striatus]|nr:hypothetical protein BDQ17DRAFT_1373225 [Cyathus striatus]
MPPGCSYGVGLLLLIFCFRHVSAEEGALIAECCAISWRRVFVRVPSMPEHIVHRCAVLQCFSDISSFLLGTNVLYRSSASSKCICISLSQSHTRTHFTTGGITPTESQTPKMYTSAPTSSRVLAANT